MGCVCYSVGIIMVTQWHLLHAFSILFVYFVIIITLQQRRALKNGPMYPRDYHADGGQFRSNVGLEMVRDGCYCA